MMAWRCLVLVALQLVVVIGDISGQNPAAGSCLCMTHDGVNIRDSACGNVIGMQNTGACFTYTGNKIGCYLSSVYYEFFEFDYGSGTAWTAGDFMNVGSASQCDAGGGYSCPVDSGGMRVHEMTTPTPYDCEDYSCSNTCQGGQCVALVTCKCTNPSTGYHPPGTNCWRPGRKVVGADGKCDRSFPINTAIATFGSDNLYYAGHAAIFTGCADDYTIRTWDQWCCRSIGYSNYPSSSSYYQDYYLVTNPGVCSDRTSWECRVEPAGPTCCPTYVTGCQRQKHWWVDY